MKKLLLLPVCLVIACLTAGIYGMVHDQISYTVSSEYFTVFKFNQFGLENMPDRLGAAWVGFLASWWMGLIIGLPVYVFGLPTPGAKSFLKLYLRTAILIVLITLAIGLLALAYGYLTFSEADLPGWTQRFELTNPVAFARAGNMHNFSYLGGLIGLIVGCIYIFRKGRELKANQFSNE